MTHRRINAGVAARIGTYSDAVETAAGTRLLLTSGTPGLDDAGELPADFSEQAELAWQNIRAILAEAGMGIEDIVRINQFLTRREDLDSYRAIRARHLGDARPASTLLFVDELIWPDMLIEIEVVAAR
ncbi:MAG: RidA family protein [Vicinamibacterales bacterium]